MAAIAAAMMAIGTGSQMIGQYQQGKAEQKISNARAQIELMNAEQAQKRAMEAAKIKAEQGQKLMARQKAAFAASNIRVDVGSPLVLEAQTRADVLKDIGYILDEGEMARVSHMNAAGMEKAYGRMRKRQSLWDMIGTGGKGFGSLYSMGGNAGWWGGSGGSVSSSSSGVAPWAGGNVGGGPTYA